MSNPRGSHLPTPQRTFVKPSGLRFDIEALRGLAVIVVVLYHAGLAPMSSGFIGVDIFFVISGYLIIGALMREYAREGRIRLFAFWGRRARRLLPAAAVVLSVTAFLSYLFVGRLNLIDVRNDIVFSSVYLGNIRFALTSMDYWAPLYVSPVLHFWSLGVEEQFYILTPLIILILHLVFWKLPMRRTPSAMYAVFGALFMASLVYGLTAVETSPSWAYFGPFSRAWEFIIGGLAAAFMRKAYTKISLGRVLISLALWGVLIASAIVINKEDGYPGPSTTVPVFVTAFLLWFNSGKFEGEVRALWKRALSKSMTWLGGVSYSAYLWHWPVLWMFAKIWVSPEAGPLAVPTNLALIGVVVTLLLAHLTKKLVEDPIRFHPSLVASTRKSLYSGLIASATAIGIIGTSALLPGATAIAPPTEVKPSQSTAPASWTNYAEPWLQDLIDQYAPDASIESTLENSTPAVELARDDAQPTRFNGCIAQAVDPEPSKRCTYGDITSDRVMVAFGDSHMDQYFSAINTVAKERGYKFLPRTRAGCAAADVQIFLRKQEAPYPACNAFRKDVLAELVELKPEVVFLSNLVQRQLIDPRTDKLAAHPSRATELWKNGFKRTIRTLVRAGITVVVIRDTPQWGYDVPDCLATYTASSCVTPTGSSLSPGSLDVEYAMSIRGAYPVDLTSAICEVEICSALRARMIIARDGSHLTKTYVDALTPIWRGIIIRFMEKEYL
ncbi:MAG: hypothetical protein RIS75_704 [Actinomycetota bacterium]